MSLEVIAVASGAWAQTHRRGLQEYEGRQNYMWHVMHNNSGLFSDLCRVENEATDNHYIWKATTVTSKSTWKVK